MCGAAGNELLCNSQIGFYAVFFRGRSSLIKIHSVVSKIFQSGRIEEMKDIGSLIYSDIHTSLFIIIWYFQIGTKI